MRLTMAFLLAVLTSIALAYHWRQYPWAALAALLQIVVWIAVYIRARNVH